MRRRLTLLFRVALAVAVTSITWLALTPDVPDLAATFPDKINHAFAFFTLSFLTDYSFPGTGTGLRRQTVVKWGAVLAYGVGIEVMQWYLGTRDFEVMDMVTDAGAILLYVAVQPLFDRIPILNALRGSQL